MGGGPKENLDVRKRGPYDLKGSSEAHSEQDEDLGFCEQEMLIPFSGDAEKFVFKGLAVTLVPGVELLVRSIRNEIIGRVAQANGAAALACIEIGFEMRGVVEDFDDSNSTGKLRLRGVRA